MKTLNGLRAILLGSALLAGASIEAAGQWTTDLRAGVVQARKQDKLVFVNFTGSDWCPPCKRLNKEILSSPVFLRFARENLVLVELDFPQRKPQSAAVKKLNEAHREKYNVTGFPTVIVFNTNGDELLRQRGFPSRATPQSYVDRLRKLRSEQTQESGPAQ